VPNWLGFLSGVICAEDIKVLRTRERTGRPRVGEELLASLKKDLGRTL
jgi:hypothetical protein